MKSQLIKCYNLDGHVRPQMIAQKKGKNIWGSCLCFPVSLLWDDLVNGGISLRLTLNIDALTRFSSHLRRCLRSCHFRGDTFSLNLIQCSDCHQVWEVKSCKIFCKISNIRVFYNFPSKGSSISPLWVFKSIPDNSSEACKSFITFFSTATRSTLCFRVNSAMVKSCTFFWAARSSCLLFSRFSTFWLWLSS